MPAACSPRHVARLIVDEDNLICAEVKGFQRQRVGTRIRLENMRVGGIDEGIDHVSERHRQQPVLAMEQLKPRTSAPDRNSRAPNTTRNTI